jgi:uncharacterized iron-regulated protein
MSRRGCCGLVLIVLLLLTACRSASPPSGARSASAPGAAHPLTGRVWHVASARFIDDSTLIAELARARFVVLGEKHDNPEHHRIQAALLQGLIAAGRRPAVAFEMFTTAETEPLAAHLRTHPRDAAGIAEAVKWNQTGWPEWEMYRPIAQAALDAGLPIVPANLANERIRAVSRGTSDALDPAFVSRHGLADPLPEDVRREMAAEIADSHCGHTSERMVQGMIAAQRARDAHMADALLHAPSGDGAVLIAGSGHARNDRGAPAFIRRIEPGSRVASIAILEVNDRRPTPADYAVDYDGRLPFDYVWFTTRLDSEDPCEKFRKSLERLKKQ